MNIGKLFEGIRAKYEPMQEETGINLDSLAVEFGEALYFGISGDKISRETRTVVVLSSAVDGENIARVREAVRVCKRVAEPFVGFSDATQQEIIKVGVKLIVHGVDRNVALMQQTAIECGYPPEMITCFSIGVDGNTKDQMHFMNDHFKDEEKSFVFVTSAYHVPRTVRTVKKQLAPHLKGVVASVPYVRGWFPESKIVGGPVYNPVDPLAKDEGEVSRIFKYAKKGDL